MSRTNPIPLKKNYGALSVLREATVESRRKAEVKCICGRKKWVFADALINGRTRSCGLAACRSGDGGLTPEEGYVPRGSTVDLKTLRKVWTRHTLGKREPVSAIAEDLGIDVPAQTLYSALRAVRRAGGIARYARLLKGKE